MTNNILIKAAKHFNLVNKHRWEVFKLCCKAGIPYRGLVHDLSKYSPTEFWESAKYFDGHKSPITFAKKEKGYSKAWLHHKGRNKHHAEYWYDVSTLEKKPIMPYKYAVEMICDNLAAGITYNGKNWKTDTQLNYWQKSKNKVPVNEHVDALLTEVFTEVSLNGIDKTINKKNLKKLYNKYCGSDVK